MDQSVSRIFAVVVWVAVVTAVLWIIGGAAFTLIQRMFGRVSVVLLSAAFLLVALPEFGWTLAAALLLLALPAAVSSAVFLGTLPLWVDIRLRHPDKGLQAIRLQMAEGVLVSFAEPLGLTPILPLVAASIAGVATVAGEWALAPVPGWGASTWSWSMLLAGVLALCLPLSCAALLREGLRARMAASFSTKAARRLSPDLALLRSVSRAEGLLAEACSTLGVDVARLPPEAFYNLMSDQLGGSARQKLETALDNLRTELGEMRDCLVALRETQQRFEATKDAVVMGGSSTLLQELDKVCNGLDIDVPKALATRSWGAATALLGSMTSDLEVIERATRMGPDAVVELDLPETIEQAYAILNVNPQTNREVIGRLVRALRQTWHPDLARDEADRLKRTAKLQQIHSAWDFINAKSAAE